MIAPHIVDPASVLGEALTDTSPDLMRSLLQTTINVKVPKLRQGTYFPEWLLERRKRAETALITVVADCYLAGVSPRRMAPHVQDRSRGPKLVKTLGIHSPSKSQVSRMAADLDEHVDQQDRGGMELLLRRPRRPWPGRGPPRHLRRPRRAGRGDRGEPARRRLAMMQNP